jgi:hypothetical protein
MVSGIPLSQYDASWSAELNANTNKKSQSVSVFRKDTRTQPIFCYNCWYYLTVIVESSAKASYRVFFQRLQDLGTDFPQMDITKSSQFQIVQPLSVRYTKFMLTSKDSFEIEVTCSAGTVRVDVAADPDKLDNSPIWSIE